MGSMALPPGFRFHPTDDELVSYYLKRKVEGLKIELEVIPVIDLYKFDPWELPEKSFLPRRDMEWFFFCPRDRKYPNGSRTNRATGSGYWKATGKDRKVVCESSVFGLRKTLVFYRGRAPGGERTDWVMHEYRICEDLSQPNPNFVGAFALCRVVKRNEHGQKINDLQGEPKAKRSHSYAMSKASSSSEENPSQAMNLFEISNNSTASQNERVAEMEPIVADTDQTSIWGPNFLSDASKDFELEEGSSTESMLPAPANAYAPYGLSPVSSYSNLTVEDYLGDELGGIPSPVHCMGLYGNEGFEWISPQFMNPPTNGMEAWSTPMPTICRQASEGEEATLWVQEDNLVIMT